MSRSVNFDSDLQQIDSTTQEHCLVKLVHPGQLLTRGARQLSRTSWLLQMVGANRTLARRAQRYIIEKKPADHSSYVQVLRLIRHAKIYSGGTNVTNLRDAFLKACAAAGI